MAGTMANENAPHHAPLTLGHGHCKPHVMIAQPEQDGELPRSLRELVYTSLRELVRDSWAKRGPPQGPVTSRPATHGYD